MPASPHAHTLPSATTVLLVDDEPALLAAMSEGLLALDSSLNVLTATSAEEALQIVGRTRVSVVVTDLSMPGKDGFWLLLELQRRLPDQPRIVCSSALTAAACYRIERAGVLECLHKPVSPRVLYQKITQLTGQASQPLSFIRGISLASILQLLELEQKSCVAMVQSGAESGKVFVVHGAVHDAQAGSLRGIEAAFRMLGWNETQISIDDYCDPAIPNLIQQSVTSLVMEAAHQMDELANLSESQQAVESDPFTAGPAGAENPEGGAAPDVVQPVAEMAPDAYPDLDPEDRGEMARLIARAHSLSATDIFEVGYEALKRGRLELSLAMLRFALQKEPENRLIQHNLRVIERKIAAAPGAGSFAGGGR